MNATQQATNAYAPPNFPLSTPKAIEAKLLSRITARLRTAISENDGSFSLLASALYENRKVWNTLAADVANKENQLPAPLRAQIFYLAEFTDQHSVKVLADDASAEILIEINTSILRGLNQGSSQL